MIAYLDSSVLMRIVFPMLERGRSISPPCSALSIPFISQDMKKVLTVEELRAKPDALIEALESGEAVSIVREGEEIATASPVHRGGGYRGVRYPFRDIKITPLKKPLSRDPVEMLSEDRDRDPLGK